MKSKSLNSLFSTTASQALRASLVLFISALAANAATFTWVGAGGDAKTSTAANWDAPYASNGDAIFNAAGVSGTAVDWDSGNIFSMTFGAAAPAYTFTSTAGMQFNQANAGTIVNNSANVQTFSSVVRVFFSGSKIFNAGAVAGGGLALTSLQFRGDALTTGQVNTLTLSGTNNGSISGVISNVAIPAGASSALAKTGTGTWTLSGASTFVGNVTVSDGTLKAGVASVANTSGAFGLNPAVTTANIATAVLDLNGFNTQIGSLAGGGSTGGNVTLGSNTLTTGGNNTNTSYAGVISGTGGVLTKIGTGVQSLSGANLYTGGTAISAGALSFLNTGAKPAAGTITVDPGATIGLGVGAAAPQFLSGDVDSLFSGTLPGVTNDLTSAVGIDTTAGAFTYASSTPANTRGLTKLGGGVLTLSGTNLHTGPTRISVGTLSVGTTANLGNANPLIFDGGNLQITGTALTTYASGAISGHTVTLVPDKTVTFDINDASNVFTISEILNQGTGGFTKAGAGTVKLTAANTYTGQVSLNAGNLIVTDTAALGTGRIAFAATTTKLSLLIDGGGTISLPNSLGGSSGFVTTIDVDNNGTGTNGVIQINGSLASSAIGTGTINVTGNNGYSLYIANLRSTAGTAGVFNFNPTTAALTLGNLSGSQTTGSNVWTLLGSNTASAVTGVISNGGSGTLTSAVQKSNAGTWTLSGANTYTGKSQVFNGTLNVSSINSVTGGTASSNLGAPVTVALGTIDLGSSTATGNLNYTGSGEVTDRVLNLGGTTGGGIVTQSGTSGLLKFTSNLTATGVGAKTLTLQGSDAGTGEISGIIGNSSGNTTVAAGWTSGATSIVVASATNIVAGATITGTGIATTVASVSGTTVNLTSPTTAVGAAGATVTIGGIANVAVTKSGTGTWALSGANTHTGATTVQTGTLTLSGNRVATAGGINLSGLTSGAPTLNIQNGSFALSGSFVIGQSSNTAVVNHTAGTISGVGGSGILLGNGTCTATYNLSGGSLTGPIRLGVNNATSGTNVNNFNLSGTGTFTSSSLQIGRADATGAFNTDNTFTQTGGAANITTLSLGGSTTDAASILPIAAVLNLTAGTFSATNFTNLSAGGANTATISIGGTASVTLPAFPTARGAGSSATLTLNGGTLSPTAASATYMSGLTNAYLTANGAKIDVPTAKDITIAQVLENAPSAVGTLTKSGVGTLTLTGANTYSGTTTVAAGILAVNGAAINDLGKVDITGGKVSIPAATNETVATLFYNGVQQPAGVYGSTASGAANQNDTFFDVAGTGTLTVSSGPSGSSYASWAAAFTSPALSPSGPTADADFDGLSNSVEYVTGGDPRVSSQVGRPTSTTTAGVITFTFNRVDSSETPDVTTIVQVSTDLVDWTTQPSYTVGATTGTSTAGVNVAENGAAADTITVTIPNTGATKKFARLSVVTTP